MLSKGSISNASGRIYGIKLKFSVFVEGDVEEIEGNYLPTASNGLMVLLRLLR